jgi:ABC-2 type transport system ATP-binding protein
VLSARGLGKQYVVRPDLSMLLRIVKREPPRRIWALQDVDLDLAAGEVLAVIGRNGAGKSTLLKLCAGVTRPTRGVMSRPRRIAPLIEVGAGFHPELTGRENVAVNARLLGVSSKEMRSRFDDIVAFAGLERAIDQPVKQYSSGMFMRLGFAVAVHTEPEVLVVDEVLAVGDLPFQVRCLDRIREMRRDGVGVLFVSHNLAAVLSLADRAVLLDGGQAVSTGAPRDVVAGYHDLLSRDVVAKGEQIAEGVVATGRMELLELVITEVGGTARRLWEPGQRMSVRARVRATQDLPAGVAGFRVSKEGSGLVAGWHGEAGSVPALSSGEELELGFELTLALTEGGYLLDVAVASSDRSEIFLNASGVTRFAVEARPNAAGLVDVDPRFNVVSRT